MKTGLKDKVETNDYYIEYFKDWLFLTDINIETALKMIKHKSESEIKSIIVICLLMRLKIC